MPAGRLSAWGAATRNACPLYGLPELIGATSSNMSGAVIRTFCTQSAVGVTAGGTMATATSAYLSSEAKKGRVSRL